MGVNCTCTPRCVTHARGGTVHICTSPCRVPATCVLPSAALVGGVLGHAPADRHTATPCDEAAHVALPHSHIHSPMYCVALGVPLDIPQQRRNHAAVCQVLHHRPNSSFWAMHNLCAHIAKASLLSHCC